MDKQQLYSAITDRKIKPADFNTYNGNNGRVNKAVELFKKGILKTGGTLLDVGGGIGDLGCALIGSFDRCVCVDISAKNLEAALSKGNETIVTDVDSEGLKIECESIDVITALDFIEHIIDPENFARQCQLALKSGGQVFINTPNIQYWKHLHSQLRGEFPHTSGDREVYHGGHLAFYNYRDLHKIFSKAGFVNCEQIKDEEGYINPPKFFVDYLYPPTPQTQDEYITACIQLGCPNLLFKCEK